MELHLNAWEDIEIVIFGKKNIIPMKIEQMISKVNSNLEDRVYSFENYEDAFDHCKNSKLVNLIIIEDSEYQVDTSQIIHNFSYHFEKTGFPCMFAIYYSDNPNIQTYKSISTNKKCIDYIDVKQLLDENIVDETLNDFWEKYLSSVHDCLLSNEHEQSLRSLLCEDDLDELNRYERISNIFKPSLNMSWKQLLIYDLHMKMSYFSRIGDQVQKENKGLIDFSENYIPKMNTLDSQLYTDKTLNLEVRLSVFTSKLINKIDSRSLEDDYEKMKTKSRRKQNAIEKCFIQNYDYITDILFQKSSKLRVING